MKRRHVGAVAGGWVFLALSLACVAGGLGPTRFAMAGDPELAKFLLKGGKEDLGKKLYDQALTKFERAEREDPALLESVYCQALARERRADVKGAVQTYRRFLVAVDAKSQGGAVAKDVAALAKIAQGRVDVLAAGSAERRKLDAAFVEELMAFARAQFVKDPTIAAEALRILLGARPDHAEAKRLLAQVQPPAAAPAPAGGAGAPARPRPATAPGTAPEDAFKAVKSWSDHLEAKTLGEHDGWTYETDALVIDKEGGTVTPSPDELGPRYAIEMECRIVAGQGEDPFVGFVFALKEGDFYALFLTGSEAVLHRMRSGGGADVSRVDLSPSGTGTWHRIGVAVRAQDIEMWLDGKKRADHVAVGRMNMAGNFGVWQQNSKVEIRLLRSGAL